MCASLPWVKLCNRGNIFNISIGVFSFSIAVNSLRYTMVQLIDIVTSKGKFGLISWYVLVEFSEESLFSLELKHLLLLIYGQYHQSISFNLIWCWSFESSARKTPEIDIPTLTDDNSLYRKWGIWLPWLWTNSYLV